MDVVTRYKNIKEKHDKLQTQQLIMEDRKKSYIEELNKIGINSIEDAEEEYKKLSKKYNELENFVNAKLTEQENKLEEISNE